MLAGKDERGGRIALTKGQLIACSGSVVPGLPSQALTRQLSQRESLPEGGEHHLKIGDTTMTEKEQAAREAELARREAALAAREAQLEQEQAKLEAARAEAPKGRKTLLNNNDPDFVNPKEKLYDKFPLTVHQMDIIIGVLFALIVLFLVLGMTHTSFFGLFGG